MSASSDTMSPPGSRLSSGKPQRGSILSWLGVAPFLLFALLFLILPTALLMVGAFQDAQGDFTLGNIIRLFEPNILSAYQISLEISAASAILGTLLGLALALAAIRGGLPAWIRPTLTTFSGVASNFAGIPLAFAFLSTLGRMGLMTMLLRKYLDFDLYGSGFSILSFAGLTLTYLYFQVPLMVLIIAPAVEGLKDEWREACESLGGSGFAYWRHIALPVLWPSLAGAALLLFANAFGAVATAYALTGSSLNIVTILLYAQIHGDVLHDQNLGYALALGMVLITGSANAGYIWLRKRSHREAA
ncbi:ABC transporter permease subunit [Chromobacterium subtsugae]|uniref:ABC transporter permease subunit n=1 Tax=Chromobacterium subtsugae TaxID=251747 RepID=A0ABS7FDG3_9NEIS|nr:MULTISPECIES: ABC transporter permease subunit [Chromobacterium]KUM01650.1 acriflavin resistance protein [Chromobacterium subtsugae]KZE84523.1 acriflavin resistance protein [Chromobacterium sp. F49]MBW7566213.1 ABC transporter permease subunit [Chromobacterium subtsugae]MBW8287334.1 ABC transporter permease subunit [Chromobacterium subtsugae]OBU87478.1 acriflavin resistance protein [Chromobacterium subtsugae]